MSVCILHSKQFASTTVTLIITCITKAAEWGLWIKVSKASNSLFQFTVLGNENLLWQWVGAEDCASLPPWCVGTTPLDFNLPHHKTGTVMVFSDVTTYSLKHGHLLLPSTERMAYSSKMLVAKSQYQTGIMPQKMHNFIAYRHDKLKKHVPLSARIMTSSICSTEWRSAESVTSDVVRDVWQQMVYWWGVYRVMSRTDIEWY
jgi:hypothetical protein